MDTTLITERPAPVRPRGRWIADWDPEDGRFWAATGRRVARRNLVCSVLVEHVGFSIWLLWSAVAASLPAAGFRFSVDQLFWLVAVPNLVGSFLRIPYTLAVARFGGRNWTAASGALLVVPVALMTWCVTGPGTPYPMFLLAAATAGFGGGNFASAMANISYFYPERHKGFVLGLNAAGGNIGVAVVQFAVPLVTGVAVVGAAQAPGRYLQNAPLLWLVAAAVVTLCAWAFMDNLAVARAGVSAQARVLRNRHTWVMSALYIGTFGSFIGYSAALPLLITSQFPELAGAGYAALGPLVGSAARPLGGWLSDRMGGGRVTVASFAVMAFGVCGVLAGLAAHGFPLFLGAFLVLFVASGAGNGSTYRMIPAIFRAQAVRAAGHDPAAAQRATARARTEAAAVIGLTSAVGAFGGFLIPRGFGVSIAHTGSVTAALAAFLVGYLVCAALTWWCYLRRVLVRFSPSLADARV